MSGAAAESILLAWTITRTGDEGAVLRAYAAAGGRGRVEKMLLGHATAQLTDRVRSFTDLLKYWRDASAHGAETTISEIEAYDALGRLL